jgi:2-polyprenyl-3-methyl-5-hydroxy-6-metoxy-1,4-benzoquinol methylase
MHGSTRDFLRRTYSCCCFLIVAQTVAAVVRSKIGVSREPSELEFLVSISYTSLKYLEVRCEKSKKRIRIQRADILTGLHGKLHLARFQWFSSEVNKRNCVTNSVLELGCFDGKLIDFLPSKPSRYVGFDANWEGGLDIAKVTWAAHPNFLFSQAASPDEMRLNRNDVFNIAVAMETLEHVPPESVDGYLRKIAQRLEGYIFVTVPNEKGLVFLIKWLAKKILSGDVESYTLSELTNAILGGTRVSFASRT